MAKIPGQSSGCGVSFEEYASMGAQTLIKAKLELAKEIMKSAIDKVETLGFTMSVGKTRCRGTQSAKLPLKADCIFYHNPDKN